jgi:PAS domain S-box-containing protein
MEQTIKRNKISKNKETQAKGRPVQTKAKPESLKIVDLERKLEILQEIAEKYQNILLYIEDGYFEIDLAGNLIFFNPSLCRISGYSARELVDMNYRDYATPETAGRMYKTFQNIYRTGKPVKITDYEIIKKDDTTRIVEISASLVRDSSGHPTGFRGIVRDVTNRKQAEEALKRRERELDIKTRYLQEANTALKVLLQHREDDKTNLQADILGNIKELITPHINELRKSLATKEQLSRLHVIETNLNNIISPFLRNMTMKYSNLTPKEIQVANLVKDGKTTKEIAMLLHLSPRSIEFHRDNIRKKFDLRKKKVNLQSYLHTIL